MYCNHQLSAGRLAKTVAMMRCWIGAIPFVVMFAAGSCFAQSPTGTDYAMPYPYWKSGNYDWAKGLSKKGDPAYVTARKAVQDAVQDLKRKTSPSTSEASSVLAKQYHYLWKKEPTNALALYRWGLCVYKTLPPGISTRQVNQKLIPLAEALKSLKSNDREYIRLRFLIEAKLNEFAYELIPIGKLLLSEYPDDTSVEYRAIKILAPSKQSSDRQMAIALAVKLKARYPKHTGCQYNLAEAYFLNWFYTKDPVSGNNAILAYEVYTRKIDDPKRIKNVNIRIAQMKKDIIRFKAKSESDQP